MHISIERALASVCRGEFEAMSLSPLSLSAASSLIFNSVQSFRFTPLIFIHLSPAPKLGESVTLLKDQFDSSAELTSAPFSALSPSSRSVLVFVREGKHKKGWFSRSYHIVIRLPLVLCVNICTHVTG